MLHKYYDWQLVKKLPLILFDELLSAARAREDKDEKEKIDKLLLTMWLARFAVDCITGAEEPITYSDFMDQVNQDDTKTKISSRTADEIMSEIIPIIDAERGAAESG